MDRPPTPRHARRRAPAIPLLLATGMLAAALALAASDVPDRLAGLAPSRVTRGAAGLAEVQQIHGRGLELRSGSVAVFGRDAATLWVAEAKSTRDAMAMVRDMAQRIGEGHSPFAPHGTRSVKGRSVVELRGRGQTHFYFRSGARVVWLAADSARADGALEEALRFYR